MYQGKKIGVVLPAGGVGRRFGADKPKQLLSINGIEIYRHCVNTFLNISLIDEIIFVCSQKYYEQFCLEFSETNVTVVVGGEHRWQSVQNGVNALSVDTDYVLAHDVARPFVSAAIIESTVKTVIEQGSCVVAKPVTDTVKIVSDGVIEKTINRDTVFLAQTPQAFSVEKLKRSYEQVKDIADFIPTDEASIMEYLGEKVYIVTGNEWNDKITTPHDLVRFEQMVKDNNG